MTEQISCGLTHEEYETTLEQVWQLMAAKPGTPEMIELLRLTIPVEAYEDEHYPMGEAAHGDL